MSSSSKRSRLSGRRAKTGEGRDETVLELLDEQRASESVLAVNDLGRLDGIRWNWTSYGEVPGQVSPPTGSFEQVLLRLPRARARLELALHLAAVRLAPGGELLLAGMNDEGIKSAKRQLSQVFDDVKTISTKRHGRVWRAAGVREDLQSEIEQWIEEVEAVGARPWVTLPGVFAKGGLDQGTAFLLEHLPSFAGERVLDFGAGSGVVAAHLLDQAGAKSVVMLEADAFAGLVASRNVPQAKLVLSDGWARLDGASSFDAILSNPPIHRGKDEDFTVLRALVREAPNYLRRGGRLIFIIQRQVPVMQLFEGWSTEVLAENTRFWVIQAVKS